MKEEDVYEILRRWRAGQGVSHIAETQNRDRIMEDLIMPIRN